MSIIGLESRHISLFLWHLPVGERQKKIEISFSLMYLYDRKKQCTKMLRNLKISKMTRSVGFFCIQFLLRLCSIILLKYHQSTRERLADFINRGLMILFEEYWTLWSLIKKESSDDYEKRGWKILSILINTKLINSTYLYTLIYFPLSSFSLYSFHPNSIPPIRVSRVPLTVNGTPILGNIKPKSAQYTMELSPLWAPCINVKTRRA